MKTIVACLAYLGLAGCVALAGRTPDSKFYAQIGSVPEEAAERANPVESDPTATAAGKKLYERYCASCHGAEGGSGRKGPSLRATEVQSASAGALFWVITNGNVRAGMPAWSRLPEPQRWQLATYLKSLGPL